MDNPAPPYAVAYAHNLPAKVPADTRRVGWLTLTNQGTRPWHPTPPGPNAGPVEAVVYLDDAYHTTLPLPGTVGPGEQVTLHWFYRTPKDAGKHEYRIELVEHHVTWFAQQGVPPLRVSCVVTAEPPSATARLLDRSERICALNWWTGLGGISWSSTGRGYPMIARQAQGCRFTDADGRRYIDYSMGHGCALLGYAPKRIRRALARALGSGAVLSIMHELEVEVAELIAAAIPSAEVVLFGKNGSDACTAAVRLARAHTGRPVVLVGGYHGWQDWNVERYGFGAAGVPERGEPLAVPFGFNDLGQVAGLFETYRGRVAAVILEPAAPVEGYGTPQATVRDADPVYLRELAALTRREGALLIFDEIFTGFRYRSGSVQRATGVTPDLTCLGKALSAGMPLAAVAGRRDIFAAVAGKITYGPTFKGEVYSYVAAREALTIYREVDVPAQVWAYGERLKAAVNQLCRDLGVPAEVVGPPIRMAVTFREPDPARLVLLRTLLQQELLRNGVYSPFNFLVPSYVHDKKALKETCAAFERALGVVVRAHRDGRFGAYLELPPARW